VDTTLRSERDLKAVTSHLISFNLLYILYITAFERVACEQERSRPTTAVKMKLTPACGLLVVVIALSCADLHVPRSIKWNAETRVKRSDTVHVQRQRRQAQALTPDQIKEVVDHHNVLRAKEGADNMELMVGPCLYSTQRMHACMCYTIAWVR